VVFLETLDPPAVEQPADGAVESAGAEPDTPVAHLLDILKDRVAVTRALRQAEKYQQYGLAKWRRFHKSSYDMSYNAILNQTTAHVNKKLLPSSGPHRESHSRPKQNRGSALRSPGSSSQKLST